MEYFKLWTSRAWKETCKWMGWDMKSVISSIIIALGFVFLLKVRGFAETQNQFTDWLLLICVPTTIFFIVLLIINFFKAPGLIHKDQQKIIHNKDEEINRLNKEKDTLESPYDLIKANIDERIREAENIKISNDSLRKKADRIILCLKDLEKDVLTAYKDDIKEEDIKTYFIIMHHTSDPYKLYAPTSEIDMRMVLENFVTNAILIKDCIKPHSVWDGLKASHLQRTPRI